LAPQRHVGCAVDFAHATFAEQRGDVIHAETSTWSKSHPCSGTRDYIGRNGGARLLS
jgi:hypothetical protein